MDRISDKTAQRFLKARQNLSRSWKLWLSVKALKEHGGIQIPENARALIEGVYGEEAQKLIPEGLLGRANEARDLSWPPSVLPLKALFLLVWDTRMSRKAGGARPEFQPAWAKRQRAFASQNGRAAGSGPGAAIQNMPGNTALSPCGLFL